jgi:hypothetical protein
VRFGPRRSRKASGPRSCVEIGTPSGPETLAPAALWPRERLHSSQVWVQVRLFGRPRSVGSSAALVRCPRCQRSCSQCAPGRPWAAAGQPLTNPRAVTSTGSPARSSCFPAGVPGLRRTGKGDTPRLAESLPTLRLLASRRASLMSCRVASSSRCVVSVVALVFAESVELFTHHVDGDVEPSQQSPSVVAR